MFHSENWDPNRCTAVGDSVAELVDRLSFVKPGQSLIVSAPDITFLDAWLKSLADRFEYLFATRGSK